MLSMTGYGSANLQKDGVHATIELKAYNSRYLDISINLPRHLASIEGRIRSFLSSRLHRGKVDVTITFMESEGRWEVQIDEGAARAYADALEKMIQITGIEDKVHLSHLIRLEGVVNSRQVQDSESSWMIIEELLDSCFEELHKDRTAEGKALEIDIDGNLAVIESGISIIESEKESLKRKISETVKTQFEDLLGSGVDENRVFAETALLLVKFDINEELIRMKSHIEAMRKAISQDRVIGKKLDFICQELNREINTIGSKSVQLDIHKTVVDLKDAVEKIREQLRNVE